MLLACELTNQVIGLAIEVHRVTGPGMLETVYESCLCHELAQVESPLSGRSEFRSFRRAFSSTKAAARILS